MNKKEANIFWVIAKAFSEGVTIQHKENDEWVDVKDNLDLLHFNDYRIKPKLLCRAFKDKKEIEEEIKKHHPCGWVKPIYHYTYEPDKYYISEILSDGDVRFRTTHKLVTPQSLLEYYRFLDDSCIGVWEESNTYDPYDLPIGI